MAISSERLPLHLIDIGGDGSAFIRLSFRLILVARFLCWVLSVGVSKNPSSIIGSWIPKRTLARADLLCQDKLHVVLPNISHSNLTWLSLLFGPLQSAIEIGALLYHIKEGKELPWPRGSSGTGLSDDKWPRFNGDRITSPTWSRSKLNFVCGRKTGECLGCPTFVPMTKTTTSGSSTTMPSFGG